jgi:hypothetical protein
MPALPAISPDLVKKYQEETSKNSSPATAKRKSASLNKFFDWATAEGHIEASPMPASPPTPPGDYFVITPKPKGTMGLRTWLILGTTLGMIPLLFLLAAKLKTPVPTVINQAANITNITSVPTNQPFVLPQIIPAKSTPTPSIIPKIPANPAVNSLWNLYASLKLTDANGQPQVGAQTISFKLYNSQAGGSPLYTSDPQGVTPDASGSALISLSSVPSNLFFQNDKLYLEPVVDSASGSQRIPVSTANVAANLGGYFPAGPESGAGALTIPVIDGVGALNLASQSPAINGKAGNLLIQGQAVTLKAVDGGNGNITINPDGEGTANFLFEGSGGNLLNASAPNLNTGSLFYGLVANNSSGYNLLNLQSGSNSITRFLVDGSGNTTASGYVNASGVHTSGVSRISTSGALENITGYTQGSGNFTITQNPGDIASVTKIGTALNDVINLTLDERGATPNSGYSTLVLNRYNAYGNGMALLVSNGNAEFDGQLKLGNFSSNPGNVGTGSLIYNTTDNKVYVWNGTIWTPVGTGAGGGFDTISTGTNIAAAMTVGTGASLNFSGTGTINASSLNSLTSGQFLRSDTSTNFTSGTLTLNSGTNLAVSGNVSSNLIPNVSATDDLGSSPLKWNNVYAVAFNQNGNLVCDATGTNCPSAGSGGSKWKLASGAISPFSDSLDVLIGSSSTASAKFAFTGVSSGTPTASISGTVANVTTFIDGNGNISSTNRNNLTFGNSATYNTTGNILLNPNGTGNVGIGTTTPSEPLQIFGGSGRASLEVRNSNSSSRVVRLYADSTNQILSYGLNDVLRVGKSDPTQSLATGGFTEFMRLDTNGNLGIGTNSPGAKLDIKDIATTTGSVINATASAITLGNILNLAEGGNQTFSGNGLFMDFDNTGGGGGAFIGKFINLNNAGLNKFFVDSAGNASEAGTLTVGNGSAIQPAYGPLTLNYKSGANTWTAGFTLTDTTGNAVVSQNLAINGATTLGASTGNTVVFNGFVGSTIIPTTGSTYDLGSNTRRWSTVWADTGNFTSLSAANTSIAGTTSNDFVINSDNASVDTEDATLTFERGTPAVNSELRWNSTNKYFSTNVPSFVIEPDVGLSSSGKAALIVDQIRSQDIFTASSSGVTKFTIGNDSAAGNLVSLTSNTITSGNIFNATSSAITSGDMIHLGEAGPQNFTGNGINMTFDNTGGGSFTGNFLSLTNGDPSIVTNTKYTLDSAGNASQSGNLTLGNGSTIRPAYGPLTFSYKSAPDTWATALSIVETSGRVGIGTTAPSALLTVNGDASVSTSLTAFGGVLSSLGSVGTPGYRFALDSNTGIYDSVGDNLGLVTGGSERVRIDNNGNVGVNTTSPTAQFDVNGNASVSGTLAFRTGTGTIQTTTFSPLVIGGNTTGNITLNPSNAIAGGNVSPNTTNVTDLGTSSLLFRNIYGTSIFQGVNQVCDSSGASCPAGALLWSQASGAIYPNNKSVDLLIGATAGATATASAKFAFTGVNSGLPTASVSGDIANVAAYLTGDGNLATTNMRDLTLGGSTTGQVILNSRNTNTIIANGSATTVAGDLNSSAATANLFNTTTTNLTIGAAATTLALANGNTAATLNIGSGTGGNTLNIGNGVNTVAQTLNLANGASGADSTVNILSGIGTTGAGSLFMANNTRVSTIDLGNIAPAAARTFNIAGGNSTQNDTINIFSGNPSANTQTFNLFNGTPTGGTQNINIATGINGGTVTIGKSGALNNAVTGSMISLPGGLFSSGVVTGKANFIINSTGGTQNILTASASGTTVLTLARSGDLTLTSNTATADSFKISPFATAGTSFTGTLTSADLTGTQTWTLPNATGAVCLDSGNCTVATDYWQLNNLILSPRNSTYDLAVGGTATGSALQVFGAQTAVGDLVKLTSTVITSGNLFEATSSAITSGNMINLGEGGDGHNFTGNGLNMAFDQTGGGSFTGNYLNFSNASPTPNYFVDSSANASMAGTLTIGNGSTIRPAFGPLTLSYKSGANTWTTGFTLTDTTGVATVANDLNSSAATANLFNTTTTNLTIGGAATTLALANGNTAATLNIGGGTGGNTVNIGNGVNTVAQTINIGAGAAGASSTVNILSGVATAGTQTLNLGTGGSAKTLNLGNGTGATAINLTSGTGPQTFLSSVASGTLTSGAFVFKDTALSSGDMIYATASGALSSANLFKLGTGGDTTFSGNVIYGDIDNTGQGGLGFTGNFLKFDNNKVNQYFLDSAGNASEAGTLTIGNGSTIRPAFGPLSFAYKSGANTWTTGFTLNDTTGNVGIGNTAPLFKLSVQATSANSTGKAAFLVDQYESQDIFTASAAGSTKMALASDGTLKLFGGSSTISNTSGDISITPVAGNSLIITGNLTATASATIKNTSATNATVGLNIQMSAGTVGSTTRFINFIDKNGLNIGKVQGNTATTISFTGNGTDMAEYFAKQDPNAQFATGTVMCQGPGGVLACSAATSDKIVGIVSESPSFIGGVEGPDKVLIGLTGQLPALISRASPSIQPGDLLTVADNGLATKALGPGFVIGRAQKTWTPGEDASLKITAAYIWADPGLGVTSLGNLNVAQTPSGNYQLTDKGNILDTIGAFANLVAANIKAGAIETQDLTINGTAYVANTIKSGAIQTKQVTSDQINTLTAVVDTLIAKNIQTSIISPLADGTDVTVKIGSEATPSGKFAVQNSSGAQVASIDNQGNATFAGDVHAKNIDEIQALLTQVKSDQSVLDSITSSANLNATDSANLSELATTDLYVTNQAAINSLSVSTIISLGNDLILSSNGNTLDTLSGPLRIQSLAMAPVELMGGLVSIDTHGNMQIAGNLAVAGRINSAGLTLKDNPGLNSESPQSASLLSLQDTNGNQVSSVDASGSANFNSISASQFVIAGGADATNSAVVNGVITTNATAGSAVIPAGVSEITIKNPKVTDYSLVYVTPTSPTQNNVIYVKSKQSGQFVVGFTNAIDADAKFNWWIVQIQN